MAELVRRGDDGIGQTPLLAGLAVGGGAHGAEVAVPHDVRRPALGAGDPVVDPVISVDQLRRWIPSDIATDSHEVVVTRVP